MEITKKLVEDTGSFADRRRMSTCVNRLYLLAEIEGKSGEAEKYARRSLEMDEDLAAETKSLTARRNLRTSLSNYARLCNSMGRLEDAKHYGQLRLSLSEKLAAESGTPNDRSAVVGAYSFIAGICHNSGDALGYVDNAEKAKNLAEKLAADVPTISNRSLLADCWETLGYAYDFQKKPGKSFPCFKKSLQLYEQLKDETGDLSAKRNYAEGCLNMGVAMDTPKEMLPYFQKGLAVYEDVAKQTGLPGDRASLSTAYFTLCVVAWNKDDYNTYDSYIARAIELLEGVVQETNDLEHRRNLCNMLTLLGEGNFSRAQLPSQYRRALDAFNRVVEMRTKILLDAGTTEDRADLGKAYADQAKTLAFLNDIPTAKAQYGRAANIFKKLTEECPKVKDYDDKFREYRNASLTAGSKYWRKFFVD